MEHEVDEEVELGELDANGDELDENDDGDDDGEVFTFPLLEASVRGPFFRYRRNARGETVPLIGLWRVDSQLDQRGRGNRKPVHVLDLPGDADEADIKAAGVRSGLYVAKVRLENGRFTGAVELEVENPDADGRASASAGASKPATAEGPGVVEGLLRQLEQERAAREADRVAAERARREEARAARELADRQLAEARADAERSAAAAAAAAERQVAQLRDQLEARVAAAEALAATATAAAAAERSRMEKALEDAERAVGQWRDKYTDERLRVVELKTELKVSPAAAAGNGLQLFETAFAQVEKMRELVNNGRAPVAEKEESLRDMLDAVMDTATRGMQMAQMWKKAAGGG